MIFSEKSVEDILSGKKSMTRRLVKEGEFIIPLTEHCQHWHNSYPNRNDYLFAIETNGGRIKWQVGRSYSVQSGRGKKGFWYCPECKRVYLLGKTFDIIIAQHFVCCNKNIIPLRVVVKFIRKERLFDISVEDKGIEWNPFVWVIEFKIKELKK